jgi:uncharacterized membrane protein
MPASGSHLHEIGIYLTVMKHDHTQPPHKIDDKETFSLGPLHERIMERFRKRKPVSHDVNSEFETQMTFGQRLADRVASFGGSWTFITIFGVVLLVWVVLNSAVLPRGSNAFDPYPYILLNLFLSMLASAQAPIILMSQNRQSVKDRLAAAHDYEVNLKAELEILALHEKIDELREHKWSELIQFQQDQIKLLTQLLNARN